MFSMQTVYGVCLHFSVRIMNARTFCVSHQTFSSFMYTQDNNQLTLVRMSEKSAVC